MNLAGATEDMFLRALKRLHGAMGGYRAYWTVLGKIIISRRFDKVLSLLSILNIVL